MNLDASTAKLFEHFSTQEFEGVSEMSAAEARVEQNGNLGHGINGPLTMIQGLERSAARRGERGVFRHPSLRRRWVRT